MENCVKINVYVPLDASVPDGFAACTPEETAMVIRLGYSALMAAKSGLREFGQEELAESIRAELRQKHDNVVGDMGAKLEKTERELAVQKELYKTVCGDLDERIESQVARRSSVMCAEREQLHAEILRLREGQKAAGGEIAEQAIKLVHGDLENMRAMLSEKDKQTETLKTMFEKAVDKIDTITQKRAVVSIGKMGEHQFKDLAEKAFRDFDGFELVDVHSVGGQGDFHLKFRDFSVLADSKLYSHKVNSTSRDKIKRDLKKNEHMHFAWLVSLDTTIDKFDKAPFMFEWLSEKKCVCYVNQLMKYEEPGEILRAVWFACKTLHSIMMDGDSEVEMGKLRERELKVREIAQKLVKNGRERETLMTQFRTNFDKNDELIRDILDGETNALVNESFGKVVTWWNSHVEVGEGESIKSTVLWNQFKKDCGDVENIDASGFKQVLCSFLHESKVVKPKTKGGALEIMGYKMKPI
jgi:hypothetical protein